MKMKLKKDAEATLEQIHEQSRKDRKKADGICKKLKGLSTPDRHAKLKELLGVEKLEWDVYKHVRVPLKRPFPAWILE